MARASKPKKVTVHGNVRWQVRWRDDSGKEHKRNFESSREAKALETEINHQLQAGTYVDRAAGRVGFREYAEAWRAAQPHRPNTARRARSVLSVHVYPAIGDRPVAAVRTSEIQGLVGRMARHLKPSSVRPNVSLIRAIFRAAVRDRIISQSPADGLKLPSVHKKKFVPLTVEQVEALADALPPRYRALVAVGAGLGLRPGELFGLRVRDIDFLRREVRVDQQVQPGEGEAPLKNDSSYRTVPLPDVVAVELSAHLAAFPSRGLVFTNRDCAPIDARSFSQIWGRVRQVAGVAECRIHDLRHFYASVLIAAGRSVKEVSERLGHTDAAMTLNVYSHLWPTDADGTRAAIDAAFMRPESAPDRDLGGEIAGQSG